MAGELVISADSSVRDGRRLVVNAQSYRWCTVVHTDAWTARIADVERGDMRSILMVPRRPELLFSLLGETVADELAVTASLHGAAECRTEIDELKLEVGLGGLDARSPLDLSGGERVGLAICIALLLKPRVLVLNDSLEALDNAMREQVVRTLRRRVPHVVELRSTAPLDAKSDDVIVFALDNSCQASSRETLGALTNAATPRYPQHHPRASVGPPVLEVEGLSHTYPGSFTLAPVTLQMHRGELVRLAGRNGSGKTTFLRSVAQLLLPDRGTVTLRAQGRQVEIRHPQRRHTKGLAQFVLYQFQEPANQLYCRNVREELLETALRSDAQQSRRIETVAEELGLDKCLDASPWDLSDAERRLLTLGSVLCANPPLILADEPTAQLDAIQRRQVAEALLRYASAGGACLFIAHDEAFSAALADRTVFMPDKTLESSCQRETADVRTGGWR